MDISIIFEDEQIVVLNKPPGLVVNRAQSVKQATLQQWIEERYTEDPLYQRDLAADEVFAERSGMVHRLDKDTSGVIVFAKRAVVMHKLLQKFKAREVQKTYVALIHGKLEEKKGIISAPIERHPVRRDIFTVTQEGRPSVTHFLVQQEFPPFNEEKLRELARAQGRGEEYRNLRRMLRVYEDGFSLVELQPKSGRTHQLRVHLKFLHKPIVGDERYVGDKRWKLDQLWCSRQWLHAQKLEIPEYKPFIAQISQDLQQSLALLG